MLQPRTTLAAALGIALLTAIVLGSTQPTRARGSYGSPPRRSAPEVAAPRAEPAAPPAAPTVAPTATPEPTPAKPAPPPPAPAPDAGEYQVAEVDAPATIRGTCRISAVVEPWDVTVNKDHDKGCGRGHKTERMVVGEDRGLANCVVTLHGVSRGKDWPESMRGEERSALVDQKGCVYVPHVQWIRPGTQLVVRNSDQADHNIHGFRGSMESTAFNFASPPGSVKDDVADANLGAVAAFLLKCDIHPWMSAYVHVVDTPYAALTSARAEGGRKAGEYAIEGIPPGTYALRCWHESMVERARVGSDGTLVYEYGPDFRDERTVTVGRGESKVEDFTVPAPK